MNELSSQLRFDMQEMIKHFGKAKESQERGWKPYGID